MLMADTMAVFFVVLGLLLAFLGLWLLCRGLWPSAVASSADRVDRGLVAPFATGLPVTLFALIAAGVAAKLPAPIGPLVAGAIVCAYLLHAFVGVAGLATCVGRRLTSKIDDDQPWRATLRGGVALVLAYLAPVLGWFVILPASIVIGSGAATIALLRRRSTSAVVAAQAVPGV